MIISFAGSDAHDKYIKHVISTLVLLMDFREKGIKTVSKKRNRYENPIFVPFHVFAVPGGGLDIDYTDRLVQLYLL